MGAAGYLGTTTKDLFMMNLKKWCCLLLFICAFQQGACQQVSTTKIQPTATLPGNDSYPMKHKLSKEDYQNKVLGLLLGSAIGDAMGAPTEMWSRKNIMMEYGFVSGLDTMVRSPSPEGTWQYNLPAGGTTDDTRWKQLMVAFASTQDWPVLKPAAFAAFIRQTYLEQIANLKNTESEDPEPFEEQARKMAWLQEWAVVAKPYALQNHEKYYEALSKFYGGEMTCAGMLYSPVVGACLPHDPISAYKQAYNLAIFDLGYARDLTALVAAMVAAGFEKKATPESILNTIRLIDPNGYFKSRLVGRAAYRFYQKAKEIVYDAKAITAKDVPDDLQVPQAMQHLDKLAYYRMRRAYEHMDLFNQDLPFHPGEIFLIALTAMLYSDFDFEQTMIFIVNYGRDNDTVAAIAGAILGAYLGADRLPQDQVKTVIRVNREILGIDLPALAAQMTAQYEASLSDKQQKR
jgi:hypothetical protein